MSRKCKNCNKTTTKNFCANCGQRTDTHRYSFKHFVKHDLVHGIWHIDSGILFTIKELFTRPGHSIREFINGKRVRHFNVITLLIIIVGTSHFIEKHSSFQFTGLTPNNTGFNSFFDEFTTSFPKISILLAIFSYSIFSFLWFRKAKLNFSEHLILNAYKSVTETILSLIFVIITIFYTNSYGTSIILTSLVFAFTIYSFWYYKQFFSVYGYSKKSLIFRSLATVFSHYIVTLIVAIIVGVIKELN